MAEIWSCSAATTPGARCAPGGPSSLASTGAGRTASPPLRIPPQPPTCPVASSRRQAIARVGAHGRPIFFIYSRGTFTRKPLPDRHTWRLRQWQGSAAHPGPSSSANLWHTARLLTLLYVRVRAHPGLMSRLAFTSRYQGLSSASGCTYSDVLGDAVGLLALLVHQLRGALGGKAGEPSGALHLGTWSYPSP